MIYLDLETTANGGPDGTSPEAHWPNNHVLLCGWTHGTGVVNINDTLDRVLQAMEEEIDHTGECWIVAHNAKFDLKYLMREAPDFEWENVKVWDTMTWEYLNSGHRWTFPSLEDVAKRRGITFTKSLDLGALLDTGVKMEDIDKDDLAEYLKADVQVLVALYDEQYLIKERWMDYLLPLAEMELNGLKLNIPEAEKLALALQKDINKGEKYIRDYIITNCQWQDGSSVTLDDFSPDVFPKTKTIKPTANRTISLLLSGEPEEVKITQKWRLSLKGDSILNQEEKEEIYEDIDPTNVGLPVDEDTLDKISLLMGNRPLLDELIKYRKAYKIVNTYLLPMLEQARINGHVHPKLNTAVTSTGRLSSSQPNGQNMPPIVRQLIICDDGRKLEEIDFSQLEMVGAASISGDTQMQYDLNHKVDIHKNTATKVFGASQAEEKRKLAKNVNFGVLYGGKAYGLSKQTGVDKTTIQELIDAFYSAYPGVARWQRQLFEDVVDNMVAHDIKNGEQRYRSDYVLPISGRSFRFIETEAPAWVRRKSGRRFSFSPNHTANYPIQGFAGGDIVMYGLWYLWQSLRQVHYSTEVQFRMTVHDSILLEVQDGWNMIPYYDHMIAAIKRQYNLPVSLEIDLESGQTWS